MKVAVKRKKWIIAALCLIGAGIITAAAGYFLSGKDIMALNSRETIRSTYDVAGDFSGISVAAPSADVRILPSDDGKCRVVTSAPDEMKCYYGIENGTLKIIVMDSAEWYGVSICIASPSITLYLPQGRYENIEVRTNSGGISVEQGVEAGTATLRSSSGRISCGANLTDALDIKSNSGKIDVSGVRGAAVTLDSGSGKLVFTDSTPSSAQLSSRSGRVELKNVVAAERLTATSSSGAVRMESCDAGSIYAETSSGSIYGLLLSAKSFKAESTSGRVRVPESADGGECEARTSSGSITFALVD